MTTQQILTSYQKAAKALHEARNALQEIGCNHNNWSSEDAKYYSHQIAELLSCDGQAGIEALIRRLEQMTGHS